MRLDLAEPRRQPLLGLPGRRLRLAAVRELHPDHDRVVAALTVPELAPIIDLVVWAGHDGEPAAFAANCPLH